MIGKFTPRETFSISPEGQSPEGLIEKAFPLDLLPQTLMSKLRFLVSSILNPSSDSIWHTHFNAKLIQFSFHNPFNPNQEARQSTDFYKRIKIPDRILSKLIAEFKYYPVSSYGRTTQYNSWQLYWNFDPATIYGPLHLLNTSAHYSMVLDRRHAVLVDKAYFKGP